jgi:P4 family phage/plasmid primase-like protien
MTARAAARLPNADVLRFLNALWRPGEVREVRIPRHNRYGNTASGYFDDPGRMAEAVADWDGKANIYVTINPANGALLARAYHRMEPKAEATTSDGDVLRRRWLLLDIDPKRPSGISSTDEELQEARSVLDRVVEHLAAQGWPAPILAASGNGFYALYPIDLANEESATALIKGVLVTLAGLFDTDRAHIDQTVFNPSRIACVIGTKKVKGDPTPDRPHRRSSLISLPECIEPVSEELLRALVGAAPEKPESRRAASFPAFATVEFSSLEARLRSAGIAYRAQAADSAGITWYHVERCPWHEDGPPFECGVGQVLPDGRYAAHCFHNRGSGKGWQEWKEALGLESRRAGSEGFKPTDLGNSERLIELHGADLRYSRARGWLAWDGKRWRLDEGAAERAAKSAARSIWDEIPNAGDAEEKKRLSRHALNSEHAQRVAGMLALARSDPRIEVDEACLDANPWSLNVLNGTLDLRTRERLDHSRADLITRLAAVEYDPTADCPVWRRFLDRVTGSDEELQKFLQKIVGYALTGASYEHVLFILWGAGANGKTTFLEALRRLLGDYALNIAAETLAKGRRSPGGPSEDLARLKGVRFVTAAETEQDAHLAEALVKRLTGSDRITARLPYARSSMEFDPYGKIFLATNHKPIIRGTDDGVWRRVRLIPFTVAIPDYDQDPKLLEKLAAERAGILNWALDGLAAYLADGHLKAPEPVAVATSAYRAEMDTVRRFLESRCALGSGNEQKSSEIYLAYGKWCKGEGEQPVSQKAMSQRLAEDFKLARREKNDGNYFLGIRARVEQEPVPDSKVEGVEDVEADRITSPDRARIEEVSDLGSTPSTPSTRPAPTPGMGRVCPGCNERPTVAERLCFRCALDGGS